MKMRVSLVFVALAVGSSGPLHGQNSEDDPLPYCEVEGERGRLDWGVGPALFPSSDGRKIGGRASLSGCVTGHTQDFGKVPFGTADGFPASWAFLFDVDVVAAGTSVQVPDANVLSIGGGLSISLSEPEEEAPDTIDFRDLPNFDGGGFNWGFFDIGATLGFESSADWNERNLTLGAQAGYAISARGLARLLPSVVASFEIVDPVSSEVRDGAGLPGETHGRWSLRGYWNTNLGFIGEGAQYLQLRADAAMHRTNGLEQVLVNDGWADGEYATVSLSYVKRQALLGPIALNSIYARYSGGQLPTAPTGDDAFSAGIAIGIGGG